MGQISDYELIPIEKMTETTKSGNFIIREGKYYIIYNENILKHKHSGAIQCNSDRRIVEMLLKNKLFQEIKTEVLFIERTFEEI